MLFQGLEQSMAGLLTKFCKQDFDILKFVIARDMKVCDSKRLQYLDILNMS